MSTERGTRSAALRSVRNLICFALENEARAFRRLMKADDRVAILITGIGSKNARKAVYGFLQANSADQVFTCGFAGGLEPTLKVGDVVFLTPDRMLARTLMGAGASSAGCLYSSPRVLTTALQKAQLRRTTGADAVDMESATIVECCGERGIPCATVRVISDSAHEDLPLDFNELSDASLRLNYSMVIWAVAKSPGKIPALLRLHRNCRFAAERLAAVLKKVIDAHLPP